MKYLKGEHWILKDGRSVIVTWQLPHRWIRVLNEKGMLEMVHESELDRQVDTLTSKELYGH